LKKDFLNFYFVLGFLLYSFYLVGALFSNIQGLSIVFIFVLFSLLFTSYKKFSINKNYVLFAIYLNFAVISGYFYSLYSSYSFYKLIFFFLKFNTLFFIPFFIPTRNIFPFFKGVLFCLFLVMIISITYTLKDLSLFDSNYRLEIGALNPIWISRAILEFVLLIYFFYKPSKRFLLILLGVVVSMVLYASGSKGPILAFILTLLIYSLKGYSWKRKMVYFGIVLFVFSSLIFSLSAYVQNEFIKDRFFTLIPEGDDLKLMEDNRGVFIPFLLNKFFDSDIITILFGSGLGNSGFFMYGSNFNFRYYPHNLVVEILLELGLVNLVLMIIMFTYYIVSSQSVFVYLLIYFVINSMFSGDLILNEFIFLYLGFVIANSHNQFVDMKFHLNPT
jgi:hypothetical protein